MTKHSLYRIVVTFAAIGCMLMPSSPVFGSGPGHEIKPHLSGNINISSQNWGICQNPVNHLIYFANTQGLIEYDGISARIWKHPEHKIIRSVQIDKKGLIFTGAFEDFGYWTEEDGSNLRYHSLTSKVSIPQNDEIWKIYIQNGKVYFQSFTSIYVYDYKTVRRISAPTIILFMFPVNGEFIVQGLSEGLYRFDGENFTLIPGSEIFNHSKVHAIIPQTNKSLFICTDRNGLFTFNGEKFKHFDSEISTFLSDYNCNGGIQVNDTLFAFGTILNGVAFCNDKGQITRHYNYSNGLKNNTVLSLYRDSYNGLWVGLDEGVGYFGLENPFTPYFNPSGTLGTVYAVLRDGDKLYIGTNHGLFVANIIEINNSYNFTNIKMIPGSQEQVWTLAKFDGQIFCGHNNGTYLVKENGLEKISDVTGCWTIKPYDGKLVEGTYTGLVMLQKQGNSWQLHHRIQGYFEPTRHIEVDYLGYIWAAHPQRGVYKLELNDKMDSVAKSEFYQSPNTKESNFDVFAINNRIVFTSSNQLYKYDYDQKKIIPFVSLNTSLKEYAHAKQIVAYEKNEYWFILPDKLALFEISKDFVATKRIELLHSNAEITSRDINILPLSSQSVLISDNSLFTICNLNLAKKKSLLKVPIITRLEFNSRKKTKDFILHSSGEINVPFSFNNVTVWFAFPSELEHVEKNFFYMLDEADGQWHKTSLDNISYLNLKYGTYHLKIRTETGTSFAEVEFTISRPWYISWYAYLLYLFLSSGIIILFKRIFTVEVRKKNQLRAYAINQNRLESELSLKTNELMLTMRYLMQKNEILTQLQTKVSQLKIDSSKYPVKHIRDIEKIITQGLDLQTEEWKGAINNLQLSEQGYFKTLKENNPNLTPHDLRLCSYLRMNFTTKEIARLLNISDRGVEIGRYRLRRKLGLSHNDNLTEYLMSISPDKD